MLWCMLREFIGSLRNWLAISEVVKNASDFKGHEMETGPGRAASTESSCVLCFRSHGFFSAFSLITRWGCKKEFRHSWCARTPFIECAKHALMV